MKIFWEMLNKPSIRGLAEVLAPFGCRLVEP
jgi:hypothetical protein